MTTDPHSLPILIVEDDEPTQNLLRAVLLRGGYTTEMASDGRQAIALLQAKQYAAVVLDMMMPEVSGSDVLAFLGAATSPAPVVICSAAGAASLTGFDPRVVKAVVRKPFDIDQLTGTIKSVVAASRA